MLSDLPKVAHPVGGIPMALRSLQAARAAGVGPVVAVVDTPDGPVRSLFPSDVSIAVQATPCGTGDAVRVGLEALSPAARIVLVVGGDTPLVTASTLRATLDQVPAAAVAMAVAELEDPTGYGRLVLSGTGQVERIVEEADATTDERAIRLVNGMIFAFDRDWLEQTLPSLSRSASGEIYLTDVIRLAVMEGRTVQAVPATDASEVVGVNTRREQARAEAALRARVVDRLLDAGATILDPTSIYVDETVVVGRDVTIHPQTFLRGSTVVGDGCVLGPGAEVIDTRLGDESRVWWSVVEGAETGRRVHIGPYCRVRPGTVLADDVTLGSFAEVKNSSVGAGTQMHHFSYLGDAQVGANVNIGAGVITVNYDGVSKHQTTIGAGAFVGSDTMLIAPIRVGDGATTGAGSVVTRDVPDGGMVVGVPARPFQRRATPDSEPSKRE
jgi:bifunctional UDP-N-acetylglucosamine pyrophosphorylase/glucosamine-1-phosphate N-acetyltransferase